MPVPFAVMAAGALVGSVKGAASSGGGSGKPPTTLIVVIVVALLAGLLGPVLVVGGLLSGMSSTMSASVAGEILRRDNCPASPSDGFRDAQLVGEGVPANNATTIAEVMLDEGLGPRGVQVAVYTAYAESRLKNNPYGHLDSVGLFQQRADWAWGEPDNRKWKGAWSGVEAPPGEDPGEFFKRSNAWSGLQWAAHDSRMDPKAASRSFADSLRVRLEEAGVDVDEWASQPANLTASEAYDWAWAVQRFQTSGNSRSNYERSFRESRAYVRTALRRAQSGVSQENEDFIPVGDVEQNGVLIVGDSIAEGIANVAPPVGFGGDIKSYVQAGASAQMFTQEQGTSSVLGWEKTRKRLRSAPTQILVSLGTNNPVSPDTLVRNLRRMMRVIPDDTNVYVLDVRNSLTGGRADRYNQALRDFAAQMTSNEKRPSVTIIDTQDIFGLEINRDEVEGSQRDGDGLPIHFSREGYQAVWDRVAGIASNGDPGVIGSVLPDCDPEFFSSEEQFEVHYDLSELQQQVMAAARVVSQACAIESDPACGEARKVLEERRERLLQAQEIGRRARTAVQFAREQVGDRYVVEGNGPDVWDCSGLTYAAWKQADVSVGTHYSYTQFSSTKRVKERDVRPGDLVFWFESDAHHVAIVSEVNKKGIFIVEAANPRRGVVERKLGNSWDARHLTGFGRVVLT